MNLIAKALGITDAEIEALQHRAQNPLADQLTQLPALSRDELELLASRFEYPAAHNAPDATLREFLSEKAKEYRALRDQIANIDHRIPALHNLKAAAQDAASRLDFVEVETLIAQVDQIETETAAETKELRAANLLLMGRADDAYRHYKAAAESFGGIDEEQVLTRRNTYSTTLYNHGIRFGGTGLLRAIDLWQTTRATITQTDNPLIWAATQGNLANALANQAARVDGPTGADLLAQAVAAYRAALQVYTRQDHPLDWAATQNNLANALRNQAARVGGPAGADLLAQAVAAYRAALQVFTRQDHPLDWAMAQNNLAIALRSQAARVDGPAGADLLAQAIAAYRDALQVYTRQNHPLNLAAIQNNLAHALCKQAARVDGPAGADLLAQAVAAYREALQVYTQQEHPLNWAATQNNIALTLLDIASHPTISDMRPHLRDALEHVESALTVFDPVHTARNHAKASDLREYLLAAIAAAENP